MSTLGSDLNKKLAPTTQTTGTIQQTINNAASQATGAVKATTQPAGNLLKGLK